MNYFESDTLCASTHAIKSATSRATATAVNNTQRRRSAAPLARGTINASSAVRALYANIIRLSIIYNAVVNGRLFFPPRSSCRGTPTTYRLATALRNDAARIRTSLLSPGPIIVYGFGSIPIVIKISRSLARSLAPPINCARNASAIGVSDGIPRLNSCALLSIEGYCICTAYTDRGEDYVGVLAISSRRSWSTIEIDDNCIWTASELIKRELWKLHKSAEEK